ncbi:formate dehydrogenase accessory sulfurtransferase FdhD [Neisseriaceae bacterium ESL0693]|nr:formate dehydrogenase accessory sulfurtransferase FdhD [Neisseriaceae bacterium ESL0693]
MESSPVQTHSVMITTHNQRNIDTDCISKEVAVALVYNGISHVVLMATPQDLPQLALGFSLSEGIIQSLSQVYDIEVSTDPNGFVVQLEIATEAFLQLKGRRRQLSGRTGCGLCGLESLAAVKPQLPAHQRLKSTLTPQAIERALHDFEQHQPLRHATGSVHGAAWVNQAGNIVQVYEDVGRHNALDKLLGWGLQQSTPWQQGFILISSRASFEMVVKTAMAGIGCLVAVSAPTDYAIDLAQQAGIMLIGFARPDRQVIYTHAELLQS